MSKTIEIKNKKAYFDYFVIETLECGISLKGNEVKSIRNGNCNIQEAWITIQDNNLVLRGMFIKGFDKSNSFDVDEQREKQLLAHKKEIRHLDGMRNLDGHTLLPLKIFFNEKGKCKVLLGVCKGKHSYDKRQTLKEKQVKRDIARELKSR